MKTACTEKYINLWWLRIHVALTGPNIRPYHETNIGTTCIHCRLQGLCSHGSGSTTALYSHKDFRNTTINLKSMHLIQHWLGWAYHRSYLQYLHIFTLCAFMYVCLYFVVEENTTTRKLHLSLLFAETRGCQGPIWRPQATLKIVRLQPFSSKPVALVLQHQKKWPGMFDPICQGHENISPQNSFSPAA